MPDGVVGSCRCGRRTRRSDGISATTRSPRGACRFGLGGVRDEVMRHGRVVRCTASRLSTRHARRYRLNKATACSGATSLVCHQRRPRKHVILGSCLPAADPVAHDITSRPRRGGIPPTATASTGDKYLGDRLDPQWVGDDHRATNGDNARTTAGLNMDGKDVSPSYERWHWQPVLTPVLPEMSIPDPARTNVF